MHTVRQNQHHYNSIKLPYKIVECQDNWAEASRSLQRLSAFVKRPLIISGGGPTAILAGRVCQHLNLTKAPQMVLPSVPDFEALARSIRSMGEQPSILIAVGGGKVTDSSKILATRLNLPLILIPTTLSNDAICSPVARIPGSLQSLKVHPPTLIILNISLIASSPLRLLVSGIGDLVANITACVDWQIASLYRADEPDNYNQLAVSTSMNAVYAFYCQSSRLSLEKDKHSIARHLARAHISSGLAMSIAKSSRPCSGSEHLISHSIDYLYPGRATHGEQVAVATFYSLKLQKHLLKRINWDADTERNFDLAEAFFETFPIPRKATDIGVSEQEFSEALRIAPSLRKRVTVLNYIENSAMEPKAPNLSKEHLQCALE